MFLKSIMGDTKMFVVTKSNSQDITILLVTDKLTKSEVQSWVNDYIDEYYKDDNIILSYEDDNTDWMTVEVDFGEQLADQIQIHLTI
jgi:hypothetical protein